MELHVQAYDVRFRDYHLTLSVGNSVCLLGHFYG